MKPSEYLDALRAELKLPSDYALMKALNVSKGAISSYRNNKTHFDDEICHRVAVHLHMHPGIVMLDMQRERARTPEGRNAWEQIFEGFRTLLPRAKGARYA